MICSPYFRDVGLNVGDDTCNVLTLIMISGVTLMAVIFRDKDNRLTLMVIVMIRCYGSWPSR